MPTEARDRILRVADLLDRPGASRRVDLALPAPEDLDLDMARLLGDVRLGGVVESVVDGMLVRGVLAVDMAMSCARCLTDLEEHVTTDVVELFTDPAAAESADDVEVGYEIVDGALNLDTLIRDALVPAVPYTPLCDADCKGLCAQCGANHNDTDCDCVDVKTDARWAALEGLRLSDSDNN